MSYEREYLSQTQQELIVYHIVLPIKYRKMVITDEIGESLKEICIGISERYEINFLEIGYESDYVHFLIQSVPSLCLSEILMKLKSIIAQQLFQKHPELTEKLWGGNFWTSGYYVNTVGQYTNEEAIRKYVESQGLEEEYKKVFEGQLILF